MRQKRIQLLIKILVYFLVGLVGAYFWHKMKTK